MTSRRTLIARLAQLNEALQRQGALPLVTTAEADRLPRDNLEAMLRLTADRVVTVAKALKGMP